MHPLLLGTLLACLTSVISVTGATETAAVIPPSGGATVADGATETDVVYGEAGGEKLLLDVATPLLPSATARPAIILVHGGAWSAGDKADCNELVALFTSQGYVTFTINYRLATDTGNHWPVQLQDLQRSVRWVRAHAARYRIDAQRIGALGGSAGGHLVNCLATAPDADATGSRVACVVSLSGPTDLCDDYAPKVTDGAWTNVQICKLLGVAADRQATAGRAASPLFQVDARCPPILLIQGKVDQVVPMDQAVRFAAALTAAKVDNELVLFDGGHDMGDLASTLRCTGAMVGFLKKHLNP